jgi:drug/metabolite transporter (DMT)-like permease
VSYSFLATAIACLGMLGVLHKVADRRQCRPQAINLFLFSWATALMLSTTAIASGPSNAFTSRGKIVLIAAVCGCCAGIAILNFQHSMRFGKISTSWLIINLSTAIPTILSILLYHERVTLKRSLSLILAIAALILLGMDRRRDEEAAAASHSSETKA